MHLVGIAQPLAAQVRTWADATGDDSAKETKPGRGGPKNNSAIWKSESLSAGHCAKANAAYPPEATASAAKPNGLATASAAASP